MTVFTVFCVIYLIIHGVLNSTFRVTSNTYSSVAIPRLVKTTPSKMENRYTTSSYTMKEDTHKFAMEDRHVNDQEGATATRETISHDINKENENETDTPATNYTFEIEKTTLAGLTFDDDHCYNFSSCDYWNKVIDEHVWFCSCDDNCEEYNDCCLGYNKTRKDSKSLIHGCIRKSNVLEDKIGFSGVTDCPVGLSNESVRDSCKYGNIAENGPPVLDGSGVIYKNKNCALCHNVTEATPFGIQFYDFIKTDEMFAEYSSLTRNEKLDFAIKFASYQLRPPSDMKFRLCVADLIENDDYLCQLYLNPVIFDMVRTIVYRNYFCIPERFRIVRFMQCFAGALVHIQTSDVHSMSVIFSFKETEVEDLDTTKCETWTEEVASDPVCMGLLTYTNVKFKIVYYLISDVNLTIDEMKRLSMVSAWTFEIQGFSEISAKYVSEVNEHVTTAKITTSVRIFKRCFLHEANKIKQKFRERRIHIVVHDNRSNELFHLKSEQQPPKQPINDTDIFQMIHIYRILNEDPFSERLNHYVTVLNNSIVQMSDEITINVLRLSDDNFNIDSIYYWTDVLKTISNVTPLSIITYSCFSVSVLALICLLLYNRKHNLVTSIPTNNLENLCMSLLLSNVLFMLGIGAYKVSRLCYVIGITLHYLWLSVFSYMTISVLYIVQNLVQIKSRNTHGNVSTRHRKRLITVIGLMIPLLFVGPAVVVDIFGPSYLSPGYGGRICFPTQFPANMIFFSGPVILSIAINFVCMVNIIVKICRIRMEMSHIRKLEPFKDGKMYLRIVILSGSFWIIGILAELFGSEGLEYVFIILCGLQGICISVGNFTASHMQSSKKSESSGKDTNSSTNMATDS